MREIKFKAKRAGVDEWVIGLLVIGVFGDKLIQREDKIGDAMVLIDPATIGQYTGLKDKNGKDIYEGDIIQFAEKYFYIVKYEDAKFVGYHANNDWGKWGDLYKLGKPGFDKYNYVVIGNIYQNPELLTNPPLPKE